MSIVVFGLDGLARDLDALPQAIVDELFPDALAAGADVIEGELAARTPEADAMTTSTEKYGTLREDLDTEVSVDGLSGSARVGFSVKAFVARQVEFGHREITHERVEVGTVAAHPFIRPAAAAAEDGAVEAFADSLASR